MISKLRLPLSSFIVSASPPISEETPKRMEMCMHAKKIHSGPGYELQITLQSTVKYYPMNSEKSEAGLQNQILKAAVLSCLGRAEQTSVLPRRREDVGKNSQVREWRHFTARKKNKAGGRKIRNPLLCDDEIRRNNVKLFAMHSSSQILP